MDLDRRAEVGDDGPVRETPGWPGWAAVSAAAAALLAWAAAGAAAGHPAAGQADAGRAGAGLRARTLACVLLAMSGQVPVGLRDAAVWGTLAAGQALLLFLLMADSFELAETVWGRALAPCSRDAPGPGGCGRCRRSRSTCPSATSRRRWCARRCDALAALDYPEFEVLVVDNNTRDPALWEPVAEHCARLGSRFRFFHLGPGPASRPGR